VDLRPKTLFIFESPHDSSDSFDWKEMLCPCSHQSVAALDIFYTGGVGVVFGACAARALSSANSSQDKLLITNNSFCIVQRATAQSKTGFFVMMV
jgi:hypothetical protein